MKDLTALILTYNEKENIGRTLNALQFVGHVLLVDSFSNDNTIEIARTIRPDVVLEQRAFTSFADQCNFGLSRIRTEWVLSIDADYVLTPELGAEIQSISAPTEIQGYSARFHYCVFGRRLRSSLYPPRVVLYRRDAATYYNEGHGHRVQIAGTVKGLARFIDHDDRKPLRRWLQSQSGYVEIEALHLLTMADKDLSTADCLRKRIFYAAPAVFLYLLFARGLLLDGWPAWFYVCQRTIAELMLSVRLLIERHGLEARTV